MPSLSLIAFCLAIALQVVQALPVRQNVLVDDLASFLADHTYQPSISALDSVSALTSKGRRLTYKQVYHGVGKTYRSSSGPHSTLVTQAILGDVSDLQAVERCAGIAARQPFGYRAFTVQFLSPPDVWLCDIHDASRIDPKGFTVNDEDAERVYGYSLDRKE